MEANNIASRLAKTAAEKRAQGWLYGGGPYGGYGGFGGYGGMNPYLGGMGYGGYGGGYGGRFGGVPMMAQSYANPYGRGGYYGMDPRFADPMVQQMNLQNQLQMYGAPRGIDIGLQGQQAGVEAQRQLNPELVFGREKEQALLGKSMQDPSFVDPKQTQAAKSVEDINRVLAELRTKIETGEVTVRDVATRAEANIAPHRAALQKFRGSEWGKQYLYHRVAGGDPASIQQMREFWPEYANKSDEEIKGLARKGGGGGLIGDFRTSWLSPAGGAIREITSASESQGKLQEAERLRAAEMEAANRPLADLRRQQQYQEGLLGQRQTQLAKIEQQQQDIRAERAKQEAAYVQSQRERTGTTTGQASTAAITALNRPGAPGTVPTRQPGAVPPRVPRVSGVPRPTPLPPHERLPPAPTPSMAPPTPVPPPSGGMGPRGAAKHASIRHALSLTELADVAARVHLEKRAALPGFTPGATTRTGMGKRITATPELFENLRQSVLPSIAKTVTPRPDVSNVMQSLGLTGMPTTLAHLPVESAIGMGITAEQHSVLRKALGLS